MVVWPGFITPFPGRVCLDEGLKRGEKSIVQLMENLPPAMAAKTDISDAHFKALLENARNRAVVFVSWFYPVFHSCLHVKPMRAK